MLLRFRCKNFRSIREEQELSLVAAKTRTDEKSESLIDTSIDDLKLLRCAAIYGPNASGKSNVLDALAAFRRTVEESWRAWKANGPIPEYDPFLLDETSRVEESEMEATFALGSAVYRYGFRFDKSAFRHEYLINTTGRDKVLYRRRFDAGEVKIEFPNRNLAGNLGEQSHLARIRLDVRPNSLFLSAAAQYNHPLLSRIYAYLSDNFKPIHWKNISPRVNYTAELCSDAKAREQIVAMLRFADAGINDIEITKQDLPEREKKTLRAYISALKEVDPEQFPDLGTSAPEFPQRVEVQMVHKGVEGRNYLLDSSRQSDGTRAYFSILGPLLDSLKHGTVLLIDELEASLHPTLARELIRIFNSPELNRNGTQFIFTTHNTNLLDLALLRRDQVWFTEKNDGGATVLYPLSDYLPRQNQNIEAGYLGGRFNALPFHDPDLLVEFQDLFYERANLPAPSSEEPPSSSEGA